MIGNRHLNADEIERQKIIDAGILNFRDYANAINPSFFKNSRAFQDILCDTLQKAYEKKLINPNTNKPYDKVIINLPPGHGKSYTASLFATWAFGRDIKNQVITVSYNQTLSTRFAKSVRETIQDTEIQGDLSYFVPTSFFPNLKIKQGDGAMDLWSLEGSYMSYLATSFGGSITGMRGNIGIIDDPIKNKEEAVNERVKDNHWDFYKNTFLSRMVEGAIQIIIMTRWATDDLAGRLIKEFGDECYVLEMPVLDKDNMPLCDEILSFKAIESKRRGIDEDIFLANYMQQPVDITGALYGSGFETYEIYDVDNVKRKIAYIDTADEGADFLCMLCGDVLGDFAFITDIYYTDESMEITEKEVAKRLTLAGTRECIIESNNGGRGFARNVEEELKKLGNRKCVITWFHQNKNKNSRILTKATNVLSTLIMPNGWEKKYPKYYADMMKYQKAGKNKHDDAPDATTGFIEFVNGEVKGKKKMKVLNKSWFGL